ncbi:hypothetical protein AGDE_14479 [Angomonas deanei]|uniref:Uncharacterized protein n=1 Tax=Angomonas deanei TaxID=59799 RepID=A0A7G2CPD9_9TRYP|nr:hypothetical protein AGDE_14479 [Angomonas deanei]CAD2220413.1 hypothetical protein, conserved [Angomonas deanei]|eukprot:EPY20730.1 hypothetical protein AGDE_14479 [Angomonas deanei]
MKLERPFLLQIWCAILVLAEVAPLFQLTVQNGKLSDVTPWFTPDTTDGKLALRHLYVGILTLLVVSRAFVAYLPRHQFLSWYAAAIHTVELSLFYLLRRKYHEAGGSDRNGEQCFLLAMMILNIVVFVLHAVWLGNQRKEEEAAQEKDRASQLEEIRRMRAAYKKEKAEQARKEGIKKE